MLYCELFVLALWAVSSLLKLKWLITFIQCSNIHNNFLMHYLFLSSNNKAARKKLYIYIPLATFDKIKSSYFLCTREDSFHTIKHVLCTSYLCLLFWFSKYSCETQEAGVQSHLLWSWQWRPNPALSSPGLIQLPRPLCLDSRLHSTHVAAQ